MEAHTKAIARQTLDRCRAAEALWKMAAQLAITHGAEVVHYTKAWKTKVNAAQMNVAKWCIGVHKSTTTTGTQELYQWLPIDETDKKKTQLLGTGASDGPRKMAKGDDHSHYRQPWRPNKMDKARH